MIKAVIFDFDGVIHNTIMLQYEMYKQFVPDTTLHEYKNLYDGNIHANTKVSGDNGGSFRVLQDEKYKQLKIKEEIKAELLNLAGVFDVFIITSNSEGTINRYFENNGISNFIDKILGQETHKSKAEKFKILFAKYDLNKDDCIFVTDTLGDILEANKLGINTIAVDFGYHERRRLEKGQPFRIISSFKEILPVINSFNNNTKS